METLIFFLCSIVGAVAGGKRCLFQSWMTLLNLTLAGYLAIWSEQFVSAQFGSILPKSAEVYTRAALVGGVFFGLLIALVFLGHKLRHGIAQYKTQPIIDRLGGIVAGAAAGLVFAGVAGYIFSLTPMAGEKGIISADLLRERSGHTVQNMSKVVNRMTLQTSANEEQTKMLEEYITPPPPPEPEPDKNGKKGGKKPASASAATASATSNGETPPPPPKPTRPVKPEISAPAAWGNNPNQKTL
ncbi:MAG: CvpA family protein [Victivallaceae bacterium]|nr:CvpA family protein [Victivallaceae bacterium]